MCSKLAARSFLGRVPRMLRSSSSPWYLYLTAVYGEAPSLPFNLWDLDFFYHNSKAWRAKHPDVQWPMASCQGRNMGLDKTRQINKRPACSREYCETWIRPNATRSGKSVSIEHYFYSHGETMGARWWDRRAVSPFVPSNSWMEVIRWDFPQMREGFGGYGYWFIKTNGTNMWVKSGNTLAIPGKTFPAMRATILPAWMKLHHIDREENITNVTSRYRKAGVKLERWGKSKILPIAAYELGYDSVQIQVELNMKVFEIAITDERAMVAPNCNVSKAPVEVRVTRCPPGGPRACPTETRTGWKQEHPCNCKQDEPIMNCM